jgi:NAD(P)-dependent dehydrogenase (short-subunit alcohol dehydrogenase family)
MRLVGRDDRHMPVTDGWVALVTGSPRGPGAAIARRLAKDGFAVAVNGRGGRAQEVSRAICEAGSVPRAFCADVTDEQQVAELGAAITGRFGLIDALMFNATGPQPAAKGAQIGLALSWARELAPSGITVNTVAPGFVPVERHADLAAAIPGRGTSHP